MASLTSHLKNHQQLLKEIPPVAHLSPRVVRILAQNPGPYTLQGTCTYLVGNGPSRILIDAGDLGPSSLEYVSLLKKTLRDLGEDVRIGKILITHWHHDHLGGVKAVQEEFGPGIPVYKNMSEETATGMGEGAVDCYDMWPKESFLDLPHGTVIATQGATLRSVFTPGHANDHSAFVLEEENAMFSGDNILGEGTGVVSKLADYLKSLERMKEERPATIYPGHGREVETGATDLIQEYINHRRKRVEDVRRALEGAGEGAYLTLRQIVERVYGDVLPENLVPPAMFNSLQALQVLGEEVVESAEEGTKWRLAQNRTHL